MRKPLSPEAEAERIVLALQMVDKYLHRGHSLAVTRSSLSMATGYNDRVVRELLEIARNEGALICNDQDGHGYYLAETEEEIERQYKRDRARALSVLKRLKPYRTALRKGEFRDVSC